MPRAHIAQRVKGLQGQGLRTLCFLVYAFRKENAPAAVRIAHHAASHTYQRAAFAPVAYCLRGGLIVSRRVTDSYPLALCGHVIAFKSEMVRLFSSII